MIRLIIILGFISYSLHAQNVIIRNKDNGKEYIREFPSKTDTVIGLSDNLEIYYILKKGIPEYDILTQRIELTKRFTDSIDDGNKYPYCVYEYQIITLPDNIIKLNNETHINTCEKDSIYLLLQEHEFRRFVLIALGIIINDMNNIKPSIEDYNLLDSILNYGIETKKIYDNKIKQLDKIK